MSDGCKTCRFYHVDLRPEYADNGKCRRYPPTLVWSVYDGVNGDWGQDSPYMDATDWCGEFRPAPGERS